MSEEHIPETAGRGLLIAGWIFAILGGLIGLAIGSSIWNGKVKTGGGNKVFRYDDASRAKGKVITIVGAVMFVAGNVIGNIL